MAKGDTALILEAIALWAETIQIAAGIQAEQLGREIRRCPTVPALLYGVVAWLDEHPDIDRQIADVLAVA